MEIFERYYNDRKWFDGETHSGRGSTLDYTRQLRLELPMLIESFGVESILDAPCGDCNWISQMSLDPRVRYVGADVVDGLVRSNRERFGDRGWEFVRLDICADPLPAADLMLLRDCWFHLSFDDIARSISNFRRSDIPLLLTTTYHAAKRNDDIETGGYRQINLELEPFSFAPPIAMIDDYVEGSGRRRLSLWERAAVPATEAWPQTAG